MMINRIKILIIMLVFSTCCLCFSVVTSHAGEAKQSITIAILPCNDSVMTFKKFHSLITYLEQETGFDINLVVPKTDEKFESELRLGNIDFAFQSPHTYVKLVELFDQSSLLRAITNDGEIFEAGTVIARKDSGIKKIEDLIGKSVMFGSRLSANKWLAAKLLFTEKGIDINKDLHGYSNGGCCEDIAFNVFLKKVDAGVICEHFLDSSMEKRDELGIDYREIILIAKTGLVPTRVFAARRATCRNIIDKISKALLHLDTNRPEHKKILQLAELGGFQKSKDEDYDSVRMMVGLKKSE